MKNYLIGAIRPVKKIWGYWKGDGEDPNREANAAKYRTMYDISRASAKKFLQGPYEEIMFQAPVLDNRLYQLAQWYCIKELWQKEPCNILWMGADTLFIKPTEIFGRFNEMRLFNYTDPRSHANLSAYPNSAGRYFNDDIRYYPATMSKDAWEAGEDRMGDWFIPPHNIWDCGQLIHNYQFWSQPIPADDVTHPELAYQVVAQDGPSCDAWNGITVDKTHVLHFHGSRDADNRISIMTDIATQVGVLPQSANIVTINI